MTCVFLEGDDLVGTAERLMLEALADLKGRGMRAVEAFALSYPDDVPVEDRFIGHHTLFDRDFLASLGFTRVRARGQVSLMRLELGGLQPATSVLGRVAAALRPCPPSRTPPPPELPAAAMRTAATLVRWAAPAAALLVAAALALPAAAATTDAVLADLDRSDVHASPAQLGAGAAAARAELRTVAAELEDAGRPVKVAVVAGRGDTRRLLAYARLLRDELGYEGTVVLTTPGGATAVGGAVVVGRGHRPDAPRPRRADRRPRRPRSRRPRGSPPWSRRRRAARGPR